MRKWTCRTMYDQQRLFQGSAVIALTLFLIASGRIHCIDESIDVRFHGSGFPALEI